MAYLGRVKHRKMFLGNGLILKRLKIDIKLSTYIPIKYKIDFKMFYYYFFLLFYYFSWVSDTVGDVSSLVVGGMGELVDAAIEVGGDAAAAVSDGSGGGSDANAHLVLPGEDLETLSVIGGEPPHAIIRANRLSSRKIKPGTRYELYEFRMKF